MRKMISLVIVLSFLTGLSFSQFNKGLKTVSGTINWIKSTYEGRDYATITTFTPVFGYFLKDNISPLIIINYTHAEFHMFQNDDEPRPTASFGTGIRYYKNNFYGGGAFLIATDFDDSSEPSLLAEIGYLAPLSENVYLDFGGDFYIGIAYNKFDTMLLGVGITAFF